MITGTLPASLKTGLKALRNEIAFTRKKPRMSHEIRKILSAAYSDEITGLEALSGRDLSVWINRRI